MKQRVDQVLKAGDEWSVTARELIAALDRLTETVKPGNVGPSSLDAVARGAQRLVVNTKKMTKAFKSRNRTLEEALVKIGD